MPEPDNQRADRQPIRLADYRPPDYLIDAIELSFDLNDETVVRAQSRVRRKDGVAEGTPLRLDGEDMALRAIAIDGEPLTGDAFAVDDSGLTIHNPPETFTLEIETAIRPAENTRLEGLYRSNALYCTQCEAEGFRRITYWPDRPDVLARFRTAITADKAACPVLLSNGNLVSQTDLPDGRHLTIWDDPFPKPSYLFALVAGDLERRQDSFTTASGRQVELNIWVEPGRVPRTAYAMDALQRSMAWDETAYGLEYDLDVFHIVAVDDFNMGAMENKSLNLFNAKYVLADPKTATDTDYAQIEAIVAHEYFHNWTGNRVTCRDWFQLSLKEGLTVYRDQQFSADMRSAAVTRIQDVKSLRARQFPEDAGPLAHPVRPASYIEINNFYTATVYEKGAEVIGMLATLLGQDRFREGVRLYLQRHDGGAATCDEFVAALADATGADLDQFNRWYSQAGTPELSFETDYDAGAKSLRLTVRQHTPPTPGQPDKLPLHIPLDIGLLAPDGTEIALRPDRPLELREAEATFTFADVPADAVVSFNRGFAAPARVSAAQAPESLALLFANDPDPFNRWEAGQRYATQRLLDWARAFRAGQGMTEDAALLDAYARNLAATDLEPAYQALLLTPPTLTNLGEQMAEIDPQAAFAAHRHLRQQVGIRNREALWDKVRRLAGNEPYAPDADAAGRRALRNTALAYLAAAGDGEVDDLLARQATAADNMTDRMAALAVLADGDTPARAEALARFHNDFAGDAVTIDKWFQVQASALRDDVLRDVERLMGDAAFSLHRPNKVRALIGAFAANPVGFHREDGTGYRFFADQVLAVDKLNPQLAARQATALQRWRRLREPQRGHMRAALESVANSPQLSRDLYEIVSKSLAE
ncbi:MAG: aminopeptidase N [Alphaproteobacteria bacterium]